MKKIILGLIVLFSFLQLNAQIISQYIETSSGTTPKGIEIWNNTASTLDFATTNLVIEQGTNGGALTTLVTVSSGTLASGAVLVIGTAADVTGTGTGFKDYVEGNGATFITLNVAFNGDDALAVRLNGVTTDVFGNPGSDPGTGWSGSGVQTYNQNISLLDGINTGDLDGWTDPSTRFSTTTTDNSLTGFGIAPTTIPLPVQLTSFTVKMSKAAAQLSWTTATETNNYGFEIHRQAQDDNAMVSQSNHDSWEKIGFVQGHGNSNSPKDYSFTDAKVGSASVSYRLKQIDFDGRFTYSDVVTVTNKNAVNKFALHPAYPNPFNPSTTIKYSIPQDARGETQEVKLIIYDVIGNEVATLVNEKKSAGEYEVTFNAKDLPSGIYFSTLRANGNVQTQKLLLIK